MQDKKILQFIFFLSFLGILVALYLTQIHITSQSTLCDFNDRFSCTTVSQSSFSTVVGIPVPLLGLAAYTIIALLSFFLLEDKKWMKRKGISRVISKRFLFEFSLVSLVFSLYLTFAETFIVESFCLFCLISQMIILTIFVLSYGMYHHSWKPFAFESK